MKEIFKIWTLNEISPKGLERFARGCYEVADAIAQPDAILVRSQRLSTDDLAPSLKAIARAGAGTNNIPVEACTRRGIPVFNTPGANANAVKELVLAALLLSARKVMEAMEFVKALETQDPKQMLGRVEAQKKQFSGEELAGKTLGVAGLGAIGSAVAEMALAMKMNVWGYDPALSADSAEQLSQKIHRVDNLEALVAASDYLTLHLPVLDSTRCLINQGVLESFKKGSRLLNFSRQEVVDIPAVVAALDQGKLGQYITDFPHPQLAKRADTILFPHLGASTKEAEENCAVMAANQVIDFLENGNIVHSVNFPHLVMERAGGHRITFSNKNIPKMLSHILGVLADCDLNVLDMLNKSHGEIAYNIIDVETPPPPICKRNIEALEGVITVRYL